MQVKETQIKLYEKMKVKWFEPKQSRTHQNKLKQNTP